MTTNLWIAAIIAAVVVGGLVLASLKGLVKMVLLAASVIGSILTYYWLQKYGFSYLSFITAEPASWMVTTVAAVGAIFVFAVFRHGLSWFSNVFSWGGKSSGLGGVKGLLTTVLMCLLVVWLACIGVFYFGSLSDIKRYKEVAKDSSVRSRQSVVSQAKHYLETSPVGGVISCLDPMRDEERLKLAKIVAYMASEENSGRLETCRNELSRYVPHMNRLFKLSSDDGIRSAMKKNDMGTLLGDPKLTRLLSDDQIRGGLKTLNPDTLFGMKSGSVKK